MPRLTQTFLSRLKKETLLNFCVTIGLTDDISNDLLQKNVSKMLKCDFITFINSMKTVFSEDELYELYEKFINPIPQSSPVATSPVSPVAPIIQSPASSIIKSPVAPIIKSPASSIIKSPVAPIIQSPVSSIIKSPVIPVTSPVIKSPIQSVATSPTPTPDTNLVPVSRQTAYPNVISTELPKLQEIRSSQSETGAIPKKTFKPSSQLLRKKVGSTIKSTIDEMMDNLNLEESIQPSLDIILPPPTDFCDAEKKRVTFHKDVVGGSVNEPVNEPVNESVNEGYSVINALFDDKSLENVVYFHRKETKPDESDRKSLLKIDDQEQQIVHQIRDATEIAQILNAIKQSPNAHLSTLSNVDYLIGKMFGLVF